MTNAFCQLVVSDCSGNDSLYNFYKKTADKLAILRCVKISNTYKDSVVINKPLSTSYLKSLFAVYNATALPARDTIAFLQINLNYKLFPALNQLAIDGDTSKSYVLNLKNNVLPCGHPGIDNLISKYNLKVVGSSAKLPSIGNSFNCGISFKTDSNYFINRLCDKFNAMYTQSVGVGNAWPETISSQSYSLTDSISSAFTELTYGFGWGDCMAGCIFKRYWRFRIFNDCSVQYMGSYGNSLPVTIFAGLDNNSDIDSHFTFYPNPASEKLFVKSDRNLQIDKLTITDAIGQLVFSVSNLEAINELNISSLPKGIYFLRAEYNRRQSVFKFLKE